jgi:hypothetical protein
MAFDRYGTDRRIPLLFLDLMAAGTAKQQQTLFGGEALVDHSHNVPKALQTWENQLSPWHAIMKHGHQCEFDRSQFSYGKSQTEG